MGLSKSKFMAGWQCLKRLYLEVHQPELLSELDEQTIAVFEQGHEVGRWAQKKFPGGVLIEAGPDEIGKALKQTERAMTDKQCPAIFEATFTHDNVLARVDILERLPRNKWRLIEVKSSTSVKDYHPYDVAIQRLILESLGMKVVPCLMYLNRDYVYDGKQYDLEKLFIIQDLTSETAAIELEVQDLLREEWKVLAKAKPPDIEPGDHCTHPFDCVFFDFCNKPLPADHVRYLPGISPKKLEELANRGIDSIKEIPKDFPLTEKQKHAWECARTGRAWLGKGIKDDLSDLQYPLYFMDFETLGVALPRYAGMSPTIRSLSSGQFTSSVNPEQSWSTMNSSLKTPMTRGQSLLRPFAKLSGRRGASSLTAAGSSQGDWENWRVGYLNTRMKSKTSRAGCGIRCRSFAPMSITRNSALPIR
jgi:hypothetical protein